MSPIDDETLDRLLGRHLSARLDGQLGKAEAAFRRRLAGGDATASNGAADVPHLRLVPSPADDVPVRRRLTFGGWTLGWLAGVAGTAAAAGLAAVFLIGGPAGRGTDGGGRTQVADTAPSVTHPSSPGKSTARTSAVRYVHNRTLDEGTVPDDAGRPVRRYRHQQVEHLRWVDDRGATVEMTIPREGVEQYELDTY